MVIWKLSVRGFDTRDHLLQSAKYNQHVYQNVAVISKIFRGYSKCFMVKDLVNILGLSWLKLSIFHYDMCQISIYIREVIMEFNVVVARESYSVFRESKVFPFWFCYYYTFLRKNFSFGNFSLKIKRKFKT